MLVDMTEKITGFDGTVLKRPDTSAEKDSNGEYPLKDFTLRDACLDALGAQYEDEKNLEYEEKLKRFKLGLEVSESDSVDLDPEDCTKLITLIGKGFNTVVLGRCAMLLGKSIDKV